MNPDQINNLIQQLLKTGELLATKAFELALRQVYANVAENIILIIALLAIAIVTYRWDRAVYARTEEIRFNDLREDDQWVSLPCRIVYMGVSPFFISILIAGTIRCLINPEWYAIKLLIETFTTIQ